MASFIPRSGQKVPTALMRPIVPIEIRSSIPTLVFSNFLAMYTTRRRLCSIRALFAPSSGSRESSSLSSSGLSGGGSVSGPQM